MNCKRLQTEEVWDRSKFLGGSDAAAAAGLNKYQSRYQLWQAKLGKTPPFKGNDATYWGTHLEPFLRAHAARELGIKFRQSHKTHVDDKHDFLVAHVDGLAAGCGLECKAASFRSKKQFAKSGSVITEPGVGLPIHYYAQVQHYMMITKRPIWYMSVGILGENDIRLMEVPYNEDFAMNVRTACVDFWADHVIPQLPPPIEFLNDANMEYAIGEASKVVTADTKLLDSVQKYLQLKEARSDLEERLRTLEGQIKCAMAEAESLVEPSGATLATWKTQSRKTFDSKKLLKDKPELQKIYERENYSRVFRVVDNDGSGG